MALSPSSFLSAPCSSIGLSFTITISSIFSPSCPTGAISSVAFCSSFFWFSLSST